MNEAVQNLIAAIAEGDATGIEQSFNAAMAEKISAKLDDMRVSVAQSMFKEEQVVEEEYEVISEEEFQALSEEEQAEYELQEEVESLDELSKGTLSSYVKKAAGDLANKGAAIGKKQADADEVDRYTNRHMPNQSDERERMKKAVGADHESMNKTRLGAIKRNKGIAKAADRLAKEEFENMYDLLESSNPFDHESKRYSLGAAAHKHINSNPPTHVVKFDGKHGDHKVWHHKGDTYVAHSGEEKHQHSGAKKLKGIHSPEAIHAALDHKDPKVHVYQGHSDSQLKDQKYKGTMRLSAAQDKFKTGHHDAEDIHSAGGRGQTAKHNHRAFMLDTKHDNITLVHASHPVKKD